ncbi:gamma-glutamyltransferase [Serratia ureilytica]
MFAGKTNFGDYFGAMKPGAVFKRPGWRPRSGASPSRAPTIFIRSETARLLVAQMQRDNGLIGAADLADYRVKWREPMASAGAATSHIPPPPSSGGIALAQLLGIKEDRAADFKGVPLNSARYIHLLAEIERVFADRADYLGDPDFTHVPEAQLIAPDYLKKRAAEINPTAISPTEQVRPGLVETPPNHPTSRSSMPPNAVSNTYTLNWDFGSGVLVKGAGFPAQRRDGRLQRQTRRRQCLRRGGQRRQRHRAG